MARIAVDMDEVIADFNRKFIKSFNTHFGMSITLNELQGLSAQKRWPELARDIDVMIGEADFFSDLPVMEGSQDVLRHMTQKHEIFITTAAMEFPLSFNAKFEWLRQNFPFISPMNIVFCGSKSILNADYLIDDNSRHFETFHGEGILFTAPHNIFVKGYRRVRTWQEVAELFL
ncbi:5' nucleotidase, NT5C type [Pantoea dispersa]|uniref:5' nucleotidase, NT5C type n=1 Tax=Pantoea dispersa TaxID=59814 RepID=UPI001CA7360B|nr:5'-3'-deoxyribonucleotidase [Pantoea dispersa]QZY97682.1 5'-3'-deoxyribonucleotidase [Pantoea dispersa]